MCGDTTQEEPDEDDEHACRDCPDEPVINAVTRLNVKIYQAERTDALVMRALASCAYEHYVARLGREPAPINADYEALAVSGYAYLARVGQEIVGMVTISCEHSEIVVRNLAVLPERQGVGIGSLLMGYAEDAARAAGASAVRLYTNVLMVENIAFYLRRGYVETHRAKGQGFDRVFFVKSIAI